MPIIHWWWMLKVAGQKWPWLIELQESWHEFTHLSSVQEVETDTTDRTAPPVSAPSGLKGSVNVPSIFTACERKQYANLLAVMSAAAGHYRALIFTFLQTRSSLRHTVPRPSKRWASGNSHLFAGPPNHPADHEMSSFHHSEMQMTGATITLHPCHNQLCILKREETRCSVTLSALSPPERKITSNTNAWKGLAA